MVDVVDENPSNEGAALVPLVRSPKPLKVPPLPKAEKMGVVEGALASDVAKEKPLKPLKAVLPSPWKKNKIFP